MVAGGNQTFMQKSLWIQAMWLTVLGSLPIKLQQYTALQGAVGISGGGGGLWEGTQGGHRKAQKNTLTLQQPVRASKWNSFIFHSLIFY